MTHGGWTVIQKRSNGNVNFLRKWADYKKGFRGKDGQFSHKHPI